MAKTQLERIERTYEEWLASATALLGVLRIREQTPTVVQEIQRVGQDVERVKQEINTLRAQVASAAASPDEQVRNALARARAWQQIEEAYRNLAALPEEHCGEADRYRAEEQYARGNRWRWERKAELLAQAKEVE